MTVTDYLVIAGWGLLLATLTVANWNSRLAVYLLVLSVIVIAACVVVIPSSPRECPWENDTYGCSERDPWPGTR